jgi:CO dehydrogenase/acetyl-CoA synthase beta subunit
MIMDEFGNVVDKCQITLVTDREKVQSLLDNTALPRYRARDERISNCRMKRPIPSIPASCVSVLRSLALLHSYA